MPWSLATGFLLLVGLVTSNKAAPFQAEKAKTLQSQRDIIVMYVNAIVVCRMTNGCIGVFDWSVFLLNHASMDGWIFHNPLNRD